MTLTESPSADQEESSLKLTGLKSLWIDWTVQTEKNEAKRVVEDEKENKLRAIESRDAKQASLPGIIEAERLRVFDADEVAALSAAIQVNRDAVIAAREAQKRAEEEA